MAEKSYTIDDLRAAKSQGRLEGRAEAENFAQERFNQIAKTHHEMLESMMSLECLEPRDGVVMPYDFVKKVVEKLRETNPNDFHARMLKYYMNRTDKKMLECRERALGEIGDE